MKLCLQMWVAAMAPKRFWLLIVFVFLFSPSVQVDAYVDDAKWQNVERIVAVGDVHGDFEAFSKLLTETGVLDDRGRWSGGKTHLVQVGDVPDRGPDSRKVMDLLMKLEKQARRAGGRVHALIGNHEAMNMYGDLRYVDPDEYQAFVDRRSSKRQQDYYENTIRFLQQTRPEGELPVFDEAYRENWLAQFPLGYVEHRLAWAPDGKYGKWVRRHKTIVQINDTIFVHGGIGPEYAGWPFDRINATVSEELKSGETLGEGAVVEDPNGPLWFRGLSQGRETCDTQTFLDGYLEGKGAVRIVVAHTPTAGVILPRYDGRVLAVDAGLSSYYGGARAALVIEGSEVSVMHEGTRISLEQPIESYLDAAQTATFEAPLFRRFMQQRATQGPDIVLDCSEASTQP